MFPIQEIEGAEWVQVPHLSPADRATFLGRVREVMREWGLDRSLLSAAERALDRERLLVSLSADASSLARRLRARLIESLSSLETSLKLASEGRAGEDGHFLAARLRSELFPGRALNLAEAGTDELDALVEAIARSGRLAILGFERLQDRVQLYHWAWSCCLKDDDGGLERLARHGEEGLRWLIAAILVRYGGRSEEDRVIRELLLGPLNRWKVEPPDRRSRSAIRP